MTCARSASLLTSSILRNLISTTECPNDPAFQLTQTPPCLASGLAVALQATPDNEVRWHLVQCSPNLLMGDILVGQGRVDEPKLDARARLHLKFEDPLVPRAHHTLIAVQPAARLRALLAQILNEALPRDLRLDRLRALAWFDVVERFRPPLS